MIAVATVLVAILASMLIARIGTVALTVTGLSRESARFQARSALTRTGFTTPEAERVVDHPIRRRIIMLLMILGVSVNVTIIGALVLSFIDPQSGATTLVRTLLLVAGLAGLLALARNERVDRRLTQLIARLLRTYTDLDARDYARLLKLSGPYAVTEMVVGPRHWLAGRILADAELTDEGTIVLGIQRADGSYIGVPRGDAPIHEGDTLILYGHGGLLAELGKRPAGPAGDESHADAVAEHRIILNAETVRDPARGPGREERVSGGS